MIKDIFSSFFLYLLCILLIAAYSLIVYVGGNFFFEGKSGGSLMHDKHGEVRGSILLAQTVGSDKYFTSRTTLKIDQDCDVALYNSDLKSVLINSLSEIDNPIDVSYLTPSFSLLDPYVTKHQAETEIARIAKLRSVPKEKIQVIIDELTLYKSWPFFELNIVNTTLLNSKLDSLR